MTRKSNAGGRQRGAGRKAVTRERELVKQWDPHAPRPETRGPRPETQIPHPERRVTHGAAARLSELKPEEQAVLKLLAKGRKHREIAERTEVNVQRIWQIKKWYPLAYEEAIALLADPFAVFQPLLPDALAAYQAALDGEGNALAVSVAKEVTENILGKPVVRTVIEHRGSVNIRFLRSSEVIEGEVISDDPES